MHTNDYKNVATYWGNRSVSGTGKLTFDAPVLLMTRWEERSERFVNAEGEEVVSRAVVWVKQDVEEGEYIALGDYVTGTPITDPTVVVDAYPIRRFFKIPDLRNLFQERRVFL